MLECVTEASKLPRWDGVGGFFLTACKDYSIGANKLNVDAEGPVNCPCCPHQEFPQIVPVADKIQRLVIQGWRNLINREEKRSER